MVQLSRAGTLAPKVKRKLALLILCIATALELIDVTIVNISLHEVSADLQMSRHFAAWVLTGYLLSFGGLLMLGGRLGDLLGKRRVFVSGAIIFTLSSALSGAAPNGWFLIAARFVQGAGAALLAPMTLALIVSIFRQYDERARAMSVWGAVTGISGSIGVTLGGILADGPGWRWIFWVNVPLGLAIVIGAFWVIPADGPAEKTSLRKFDFVGAVLSAGAIGMLIYGISSLEQYSMVDLRSGGSALIGLSVLTLFVIWEKHARHPLIDLALLRIRSVAGSNLIAFTGVAGQYSIFYLLAIYLQEEVRYPASMAGLLYLPMTICSVVVAARVHILVAVVGVRRSVVLGAVMNIAGLLLLALGTMEYNLWSSIIMPSIIIGLGSPCWFVPISAAAIEDSPSDLSGLSSALLNTNRTIGGAFGVAMAATILNSYTHGAVATPLRVSYLATCLLYVLVVVFAFWCFRGCAVRIGARTTRTD